jgi:NAD(P)H dehydrogenase (quinone)
LRVLIVFCHPDKNSFAASLYSAAVEALKISHHEVVELDLYKEGFDPTLSQQEWRRYHDTSANFDLVRRYTEDLKSVNAIVLIYPTWWNGMPAILKGYIERVWLPGIAFNINPHGGVTFDNLPNVYRFVVITTYGSAWWINSLLLGNPGKKMVMRGLARQFRPYCKRIWIALYDLDRATPKKRVAFLNKVKATLRSL